MASPEPNITLYFAKICPFSNRVLLALAESKVPHSKVEIDLKERPSWYTKVNPAGKTPAITYGGSQRTCEEPAADSTKITESLVLLDFINDIDPEHRLLPTCPLQRARVRFFMEKFNTYYTPVWNAIVFKGEDPKHMLQSIDALQALLSPNEKYAVGDEVTLADITVFPFFLRTEISLGGDYGAYNEGAGKKVWDMLMTEEKYGPFRNYYNALKARDTFQWSYDEPYLREVFKQRFSELREYKRKADAEAAAHQSL